jgi:hypothetical protein
MRNFDLQIIWSARTPYTIPGFLALHLQIEAERTTTHINEVVEKWFNKIDAEKKASVKFIHLN